MKIVQSLVLLGIVSVGVVRAQPTDVHLFRDGCVISTATLSAPIAYTGPAPPAGFQDCIVTTKNLLLCLELNAEFARVATPPATCATVVPYPFCPSVKGATWGLECDAPDAANYTGDIPVGFKYCAGTTTVLSACAEVTAINFATKVSFGVLRGADSSEGERPVAKFIEEVKGGGEMMKTEEYTSFPLVLNSTPLNHCIFQDGTIIGCRAISSSQYKDQLPYFGFTGVYFRDGAVTQGYIPALPTVTGLQYAMASVFQFLTDNLFVSTSLTP